MSFGFKHVFREDIDDTFLSVWNDEFVTNREFMLKGKSGTNEIKNLNVIWNQDSLRNIPAVVSFGQLMIGDVLLLTRKCDWLMRPRRYQLIYSPRDTQWEIVTCQEILRAVYRIQLTQRTTPG